MTVSEGHLAEMSDVADVDARLVAALRRNARASVTELAAEVGVGRATVRARMARLEREGVVLGYTAVLRTDAEADPVRGIVTIEIEGKGTDRVVRALGGLPEVLAIHSTNGRWDLVAEIGTRTLAELDAALRRIRLIDGVARSETSLYLSTKTLRRAGRD